MEIMRARYTASNRAATSDRCRRGLHNAVARIEHALKMLQARQACVMARGSRSHADRMELLANVLALHAQLALR